MEMLNFGSERFLFDNLYGWLKYTRNAVRTLIKGVFGVSLSIFIGMYTVFRKICSFLAKIIRMRPVLSVLIAVIAMSIVSTMSIVNVMVKSKTYEHQRDSLAYELLMHKQSSACGSVIAHDTIYINKN